MKTALVVGANGQDGSYLCDELLARGYAVHGSVRRASLPNTRRIRHLLDSDDGRSSTKEHFTIHLADMSDPLSVHRLLWTIRPDEVYNVADQDHVGSSRSLASYAADVTAGAVCRLLESVSMCCPEAKVFQPASSTMFRVSHPASVVNEPTVCDENSPLDPRSPYAVSKVAAYHWARYYRLERGLRVWTGIMFNHDSPRRGPDYLLQRLCKAAVLIAVKRQETVELDGLKDWLDVGHAKEYMENVVDMLNDAPADDYVFASNKALSIGTLWNHAFVTAGGQLGGYHDYSKDVITPPSFPRKSSGFVIGRTDKAFRTFGFKPVVGPDKLVGQIVAEWKRKLDRGEI